MSWREAWNLVGILVRDPSSQVGAAMAGWEAPKSAEWLILADLYDLQHMSKAKRAPKPYPRPTDVRARKRAAGKPPVNARAKLQQLASGGFAQTAGPHRGPDGRFAKRPA